MIRNLFSKLLKPITKFTNYSNGVLTESFSGELSDGVFFSIFPEIGPIGFSFSPKVDQSHFTTIGRSRRIGIAPLYSSHAHDSITGAGNTFLIGRFSAVTNTHSRFDDQPAAPNSVIDQNPMGTTAAAPHAQFEKRKKRARSSSSGA